jgi:hypothetical protein
MDTPDLALTAAEDYARATTKSPPRPRERPGGTAQEDEAPMQTEPTHGTVAQAADAHPLNERAAHLALESLAGATALALDVGLTIGQLHAALDRAATDFAAGVFDPRWDVPSFESLAAGRRR